MNNPSRSVRFPSVAFASLDEFEAYHQVNRERFDGRYLHETSLASSEPVVRRPGSCAVCLRSAVFSSSTARGEPQAGGLIMPEWVHEQYCDCEDRIPQRGRALLHFAQASGSLHAWTRLMTFGRPGLVDNRLRTIAHSAEAIERLRPFGFDNEWQPRYRIDVQDASFHLVVSTDYLQHVPPLSAALNEIRRALVPGGRFIFTVPFRMQSATSESRIAHLRQENGALPVEINEDAHELGWDLLDRIHEAGFADARVHTYWSDELGYLGSFKTICMAMT
jgi:hypothetical protein